MEMYRAESLSTLSRLTTLNRLDPRLDDKKKDMSDLLTNVRSALLESHIDLFSVLDIP
jgi:hypothetical protein